MPLKTTCLGIQCSHHQDLTGGRAGLQCSVLPGCASGRHARSNCPAHGCISGEEGCGGVVAVTEGFGHWRQRFRVWVDSTASGPLLRSADMCQAAHAGESERGDLSVVMLLSLVLAWSQSCHCIDLCLQLKVGMTSALALLLGASELSSQASLHPGSLPEWKGDFAHFRKLQCFTYYSPLPCNLSASSDCCKKICGNQVLV